MAMMTHLAVPVRLFAALREKAGQDVVTIEVPEGADVAALRRCLRDAAPAIAPYLPSCRVAIDHVFVQDDAPVTAGQDIALIPPVGGG